MTDKNLFSIINTLRTLSKSGLCLTQVYPRSDTLKLRFKPSDSLESDSLESDSLITCEGHFAMYLNKIVIEANL